VDAGGSALTRANLERIRQERLGVALSLSYTAGGGTAVGPHTHTLHLSGDQLKKLDVGESAKVSTSLDNGHEHVVTVTRDTAVLRRGFPEHTYKMTACDTTSTCGDADAYAEHVKAVDDAVMQHEPWGRHLF
jgi:hypothetical protein